MSGDAPAWGAAHDARDGNHRTRCAGPARLPGLHTAPAGEVLMTANGWLQILFFAAAILVVTKPVGVYILRVYDGSFRWLAPVERVVYRLGGVDPADDQHWTRYAA